MEIIIHALKWHVTVPDQKQAASIQKELADLTASPAFLKELEQEIAALFADDNHYVIEKLELDLGNITPEKVSLQVKRAILEQVKSVIKKEEKGKEIQQKEPYKAAADLFIKFLETGNVPSGLPGSIRTHADMAAWLTEHLGSQTAFTTEVWRIISQRPQLLNALANLPIEVYSKTLSKPLNRSTKVVNWLIQAANAVKQLPQQQQVSKVLWRYLLFEESNRENTLATVVKVLTDTLPYASNRQVGAIQKAIEQMQPHTGRAKPEEIETILKQLKKEPIQAKHQKSTSSEGLHINNAGLVIVAPFLDPLFKQFGVVEGKKLIKPEKALAFLDEIEWGKLGKAGADFALPKLLCGLPVDEPIQPADALTPKEKRETNQMLQELIEHWKALKSTSPDGLRTNYFWREGLLRKVDMGYELRVESKAQDILLAHLPWGIGTIMLPWMKEPLNVDWM